MYFAGPSDKNIRFIEDKFKAKIVLRGDELLVDGDKKEIQILKKLVNEMVSVITRKESISTSDIEVLLNSQGETDKDSYINNYIDEKIILHTHKEPIYAKTKGQKKYYQAVLKNDNNKIWEK